MNFLSLDSDQPINLKDDLAAHEHVDDAFDGLYSHCERRDARERLVGISQPRRRQSDALNSWG